MGLISSIAGAVAGPLLGKALGGGKSGGGGGGAYATPQSNQMTQQQMSHTGPWSGLIPYLTGSGSLPDYLYGTPDLTKEWLHWADRVGGGGGYGDPMADPGQLAYQAPPPMMFDYVRNQEFGNKKKGNRVSSMPKGGKRKKDNGDDDGGGGYIGRGGALYGSIGDAKASLGATVDPRYSGDPMAIMDVGADNYFSQRPVSMNRAKTIMDANKRRFEKIHGVPYGSKEAARIRMGGLFG